MKILIVSTLKRKVTKEITASRSQIIYRLSRGLAKRGHQISILGTGDTYVEGCQTIPVIEKGWVDLPAVENQFYLEVATMIQLIRKMVEIQADFDIIHNHLYPEFLPPIVENELKTSLVTTVHSQWTDFIDDTLALFKKTYFISISKAHRSLFKKANFYKIVYNGIDTDLFSFNKEKEDYLLWIGRLSKAKNKDGSFMDPKGVRWAIKLAQETGSKLILTGNVEDFEFYERDVKPHLNEKIQWYGPVAKEQAIPHQEIVKLMQAARAFLMTINWYEPFGLVMAEAMSCGTPVIGFDRGAVCELLVDGKTGFVIPYEKGIEGLKEALSKINQINPQDCRGHVVKNFSVEQMVMNYEKVYQEMIGKRY
jgi:glycosyltransferase involved in cell wall biosynthesis